MKSIGKIIHLSFELLYFYNLLWFYIRFSTSFESILVYGIANIFGNVYSPKYIVYNITVLKFEYCRCMDLLRTIVFLIFLFVLQSPGIKQHGGLSRKIQSDFIAYSYVLFDRLVVLTVVFSGFGLPNTYV